MANRYKVVHGGPYPHFVTCSIIRWFPVFVSGPYFNIITDSLKYLQSIRNLLVHAYVIMPTHLHAIVTSQDDDLSGIMRDFKKFTSRAIYNQAEQDNDQLLTWLFRKAAEKDQRTRFKVWQDEFHPKAITYYDMFLQKAEYIHSNPVRKELCDVAENWYYSSARFYASGKSDPLEVDILEW